MVKMSINSSLVSNIILINLDGLRKDKIDSCPNLKSFRDNNAYFSKMISVSPYTLAAHNSIFSGLYPSQNGVNAYYHMFRFKENEITTFTQLLRNAGYYTRSDVISENLVPKQGFDKITVFDEKIVDFKSRHSEIINEVSKHEKFFLFLHYEGVHSRLVEDVLKKYDPKANEDEYFKERDENDIRYESFLPECDEYVKEIIETVEKLPNKDKVVLIFFADHGASIGEKQGEKFYGVYTYDYTINSFCIINYIGKKKIDTQCSILDIFPTCLEIADVNYSLEYDLEGESLLPWVKKNAPLINEEKPVFVETGALYGYWPSPKKHNVFCVRYQNKKLIYNDTPKSWEFYNLEMDPGEISNIFDENSNEVKKFKQMLTDYLSKLGIKTKITS